MFTVYLPMFSYWFRPFGSIFCTLGVHHVTWEPNAFPHRCSRSRGFGQRYFRLGLHFARCVCQMLWAQQPLTISQRDGYTDVCWLRPTIDLRHAKHWDCVNSFTAFRGIGVPAFSRSCCNILFGNGRFIGVCFRLVSHCVGLCG